MTATKYNVFILVTRADDQVKAVPERPVSMCGELLETLSLRIPSKKRSKQTWFDLRSARKENSSFGFSLAGHASRVQTES